jgi:hypothetical protein
METRECEFNVTALLGLNTTGFGRPLYGFDWLFLPVLDKLFIYHCSTTSRIKIELLIFGFHRVCLGAYPLCNL